MKRILTLCACTMLILSACHKNNNPQPELRHFDQINLVDNNGQYQAKRSDGTLLNAWGLAFSPGGVAWVNSQGGHVSEVWDNLGNILRPAVNIPSPGDTVGGNPTGIIFNGTTDFKLANGSAAAFVFVGVDGILSAWNGPAGANAKLIHDNSATSAYTGLAAASNGGANFLYAANFRANRIDVWDKEFAKVNMTFSDPAIPAGYAPFNIQAVSGELVVTYAKVGADGRDEPGVGKGFVDIFSTDGKLQDRLASRGTLNAPWGVAPTTRGFIQDNDDNGDDDGHGHSGRGNGGDGKDDNRHQGNASDPVLLVGNFGDGYINAFDLQGNFLGQLRAHGKPLVIDGLWALSFPPATATAVDPNRLYFTAGPNNEQDGLFGYLIKQ